MGQEHNYEYDNNRNTKVPGNEDLMTGDIQGDPKKNNTETKPN